MGRYLTILEGFLADRRVVDKGVEHTHTSLDPPGKYYINPEDVPAFHVHYQNALYYKANLCITEKPQETTPLRADFDFKTRKALLPEKAWKQRQYTPRMVETVARYYREEIALAAEPVLSEPGGTPAAAGAKANPRAGVPDEYLACLVLEKSAPREEGDNIKDGFHLHFPGFFCEAWTIEHLHRKVTNRIRDSRLFAPIVTSAGVDQMCDSIARHAWLMYGSAKGRGKEPFAVTYALGPDGRRTPLGAVFHLEMVGRQHQVEYYLPQFLSIRPNERAAPIRPEVRRCKMAYVKKPKRRAKYVERPEEKVLEELRYIKDHQILEMLADARADDYSTWMYVGFALHSIGQGHEIALQMWTAFSARSAKFVDGECAERWEQMQPRGDIKLATLLYLARQDSPEQYREFRRTDLLSVMRDSLFTIHPNELAIANVIKLLFKGRFVCADPKQGLWYMFRGHRWVEDPSATHLNNAILTEVIEEYRGYQRRLMDLHKELGVDPETEKERKKNTELQKKCVMVVERLGTTSFLRNLVKMCQNLLYDEQFLKKKDENKKLFGCENGVLDLGMHTFRPGTPDDYISYSCGFDYKEFDANCPDVVELEEFLAKVFPNPNIRNYFLDVACSCLEGGNPNKKFLVLTGDTNGGKSKSVDLLTKTFGDYAINFPRETVIRGRGTTANAPRPELARVRGVRVATLHEIGKGETINIGVLKAMTGNDTFFARTLHDKGTEIRPMFTLFMQCNDPPRIPDNDHATWERTRTVPFESKFDDNPPWDFEEQLRQHHFQADKSLEPEVFAQAFLWMLNRRFARYKKTGLVEPAEVKLSTRKYKANNDVYQQFLDECVRKIGDEKEAGEPGAKKYVSVAEMYATFREWYRENHPSYAKECPGKLDMVKDLVKRLGQTNSRSRWVGYRIVIAEGDDEPDALAGGGPAAGRMFKRGA